MNNETDKKLKQIVRIANNNLKGNAQLWIGLRNIKGIGFNLAKIICRVAEIDETKKIGYLSDEEIKKIDNTIKNIHKLIPNWLLNLRKEIETGKDYHFINTDLIFKTEQIIRNYKKLKNYKGIRHSYHLPVRGQRTKANFRPSKRRNKNNKKVKRKSYSA